MKYYTEENKNVYRTVQDLRMLAFTKKNTEKFTEFFRIKRGTFNSFARMFRILF